MKSPFVPLPHTDFFESVTKDNAMQLIKVNKKNSDIFGLSVAYNERYDTVKILSDDVFVIDPVLYHFQINKLNYYRCWSTKKQQFIFLYDGYVVNHLEPISS